MKFNHLNICILFFAILFFNQIKANTTPTFHAIIVTEHDKKIGSVRDSIRVNAEIKLIAEMSEMTLKAKNFGRYDQGIGDYVINLNPSADDVVMFYYTGHGGNNQTDDYESEYPEFDNDEFTFKAEKIYNRLKAKNARLTFVFFDCCNHNVYGNLPGNRTGVGRTLPSSAQVLLFRNAKGGILLCSSKQGQYSKGTALVGGFATDSFFKAIQQVEYGTKAQQLKIWDNVLKKMATNTKLLNRFQDPLYKNEITGVDISNEDNSNQPYAAPTKTFKKSKDL